MSIYLITGANRGIGRGVADIILSRPNNTLVALVRDPEDATAKSLKGTAEGTKVIMHKYEASDYNAASTAIKVLEADHHIASLDIVIANAGSIDWRGPSSEAPPDEIIKAMNINTIAPILLFNATLPLLKHSQNPKFFAISSAIGSIEMVPKLMHASVLPYGMSKAAMNHAFRKFAFEHPDIDVEMLTPGPVATDLMRKFRPPGGIEEMKKRFPSLVDYEDSVKGLMKCIDKASKETTGSFRNYAGETVPW